MANTQAKKDNNSVSALIGISSVDGVSTVPVAVDPTTGRLLVDNAGGTNLTIGTSTITSGTTGQLLYDNAGVLGELALATYPSLTELSYVKGVTSAIQTQINAKGAGTVTAVSIVSANGISGTSGGGTTPALTLALGAITPSSVTTATIKPASDSTTAIGIYAANGTTKLINIDSSTPQIQVGIPSNLSGISNYGFSVGGSVNDYYAMGIQNTNTGDSASTDITASADNDGTTLYGHFIDMGINNSGFSPVAVGNVRPSVTGLMTINAAGTGYLLNDTMYIVGGDNNAYVKVTGVSGTTVTQLTLTDNGTGYSVGTAVSTATYGSPGTSGTGCKVNVNIVDNTIWTANDGYIEMSGGNLIIQTDEEIAGKVIKFATGGESASNLRMTISDASITTPTPGNATQCILTTDATQTLTNKRVTPRILSAATYTTNTGTSINGDTLDMFIVTAQAGALLFNNPSGTPTDGQKLIISVASSTTAARALTWGNAYGATTVALPTTTTATTATLTIGFIWSASKSLWQCVAVA